MKTTEASNNFYQESTAKLLHARNKDSVKIHKKNGKCYQFTVENDADQSSQSQCDAGHTLQSQTVTNCTLLVGRCDAAVQTDREPVTGGKSMLPYSAA